MRYSTVSQPELNGSNLLAARAPIRLCVRVCISPWNRGIYSSVSVCVRGTRMRRGAGRGGGRC